jgi:hypothetical protein
MLSVAGKSRGPRGDGIGLRLCGPPGNQIRTLGAKKGALKKPTRTTRLKHLWKGASTESVEAENPDRVFVLAVEQVQNDGLVIGGLELGLPPGPAEPAQIVNHQTDILIITARHDRGRPVGLTHYKTPTPQNRDARLALAIRSGPSDAPISLPFRPPGPFLPRDPVVCKRATQLARAVLDARHITL